MHDNDDNESNGNGHGHAFEIGSMWKHNVDETLAQHATDIRRQKVTNIRLDTQVRKLMGKIDAMRASFDDLASEVKILSDISALDQT